MNYPIPPVRNVIALLTNQCNCACKYCFEQRSVERMTLDTAKDILNFVHKSESPVPGFTFFGGEPLLEFDSIIVPLIEYERGHFPYKTHFAMTTNGVLLDKDKVDFLRSNQINFMLSIDGTKSVSDYNRPLRDGGSSYDKIIEILPYIMATNNSQTLRITLSAGHCDTLFEDIKFFSSIGNPNIMVYPNYFEVWDDSARSQLEDQIAQYEQYIIEGFLSGSKPYLLYAYSYAFYNVAWLIYRKELGRRKTLSCSPNKRCGLGVVGSASVDYKGDLYGCHHISPMDRDSPFYIGNIYEGLDENKIRALVDSYDAQRISGTDCENCPIDSLCTGGCLPNNYQLFGDIHKVPSMYCFWNRLITDSAYRIAQRLGGANIASFNQFFNFCLTRRGWYGRPTD